MSRHETVYRALLRIYPRPFLDSYESEMLVAFRDQRRDARDGRAPWAAVLTDIGRSAPVAWQDQLTQDLHTMPSTMKAIAVAAMVVGGFEMLNTFVELSSGGIAGRDTVPLIILMLAAAVGALLILTGVALIRRGREASRMALWASAACLAEFIAMPLTRAGLSGLSTLVGLALPIVLIGYLAASRPSRAAR